LPPLRAYTFDIGGSLAGIALFSVQSALATTPVTWVVTGSLLLILAWALEGGADGRRGMVHTALGGVACAVLLLSVHTSAKTTWSMYQKLEVKEAGIHV